MASEIVERVAKAIRDTNANTIGLTFTELSRAMARAAIEAMREPTKAMILSGDDAKENCIDSDWESDADGNRHDYTIINSDLPAIVFRAMIDEALREQDK